MGKIYDEFEDLLKDWKVLYANNPREEMLQLCLLALEREQIVTVAFDAELVKKRLAELSLPEELKELILHALLWAWKDEEMHAIYIRGILLKLGGLSLKAMAIHNHFAGAIGGWASATKQHYRWHEAPIALTTASILTGIGKLASKVPDAVAKELVHLSFKQFCVFNIDAEHTAARAWQRLIEVAEDIGDDGKALAHHVERMRIDEENHRLIFEVFAHLLTDDDQLKEACSINDVKEKIAGISPYFLPPSHRPNYHRSPIGKGQEVVVYRGQTVKEKTTVFRQFLEESGLRDVIKEKSLQLSKPIHELKVAIKTTFMLGYHRRDLAPIIDPELLKELGRTLSSWGLTNITVLEANNIYDHFFHNRQVENVARYFRLESNDYRIVDAGQSLVPHAFQRGMADSVICQDWRDAELRLSFGKLRSHPIDLAYMTVNNLEGLGTKTTEYLFFDRLAQRCTPVLMMLEEFPPDFALLDAYHRVPDGLAGIMGTRRARHPLRFYGARDALSLDLLVAKHIRAKVDKNSPLYKTAIHWFGDPRGSIYMRGETRPLSPWRGPHNGAFSSVLATLSYPVYQFGSQRGAVFVPSFDERAFPPKKRASPFLRTARRSIQSLLGLPSYH